MLTPLLLPDGSAVLVDRGWVPPAPRGHDRRTPGATAPTGDSHHHGSGPPERVGATPVERRNGRLETRRATSPRIAAELRLPGATAPTCSRTSETPGAAGLPAIPVGHENDWLNFGYAVQWWIFAGASL